MADLVDVVLELVERLGLGGVGHPGVRADRLAERLAEVLDELGHPVGGGLRVVAVDVDPADGLAEHAGRGADGLLPARAVLLLAAQGAAVEVERGLPEGGGEQTGGLAQRPGAGVGLPRLQRDLDHQAVEAGQERGLPDDDGFQRGRQAQRLGHHVDVEVRVHRHHVGDGHRVVAGLGVAVLDPRPLVLGDPRLQRQDVAGGVRAAVPAGEVVERLEVAHVARAGVGEPVLEVVALVREPGARLPQREHVAVGVLGVDANEPGDRRRAVARAVLGEVPRQRAGRVDRVDAVEVGLERGDAESLDARRVHVGGVVVADLAGVGVHDGAAGGVLDDGADVGLGPLAEQVEGAVARAVGRDLDGVEPGAVDVAEEVVLGADLGVHGLGVDAEGALREGRGSQEREGGEEQSSHAERWVV